MFQQSTLKDAVQRWFDVEDKNIGEIYVEASGDYCLVEFPVKKGKIRFDVCWDSENQDFKDFLKTTKFEDIEWVAHYGCNINLEGKNGGGLTELIGKSSTYESLFDGFFKWVMFSLPMKCLMLTNEMEGPLSAVSAPHIYSLTFDKEKSDFIWLYFHEQSEE